MDKMGEQKGNFSREMETIKKNTVEILELKNTISEIKNSLDGFNIRLDTAQEKVSELKDRSIEIIQNETEGEKMKITEHHILVKQYQTSLKYM